jgi:hypothetical protein
VVSFCQGLHFFQTGGCRCCNSSSDVPRAGSESLQQKTQQSKSRFAWSSSGRHLGLATHTAPRVSVRISKLGMQEERHAHRLVQKHPGLLGQSCSTLGNVLNPVNPVEKRKGGGHPALLTHQADCECMKNGMSTDTKWSRGSRTDHHPRGKCHSTLLRALRRRKSRKAKLR